MMLKCNKICFYFAIICFIAAVESRTTRGRKITFSTATSVDSRNIRYSSRPEAVAGSQEYYKNHQWVSVTSDGYEQEGSLAEVMEEMLPHYNDEEEQDNHDAGDSDTWSMGNSDGVNYNDNDGDEDSLLTGGADTSSPYATRLMNEGDSVDDYSSITPSSSMKDGSKPSDEIVEAMNAFRYKRNIRHDTRFRVSAVGSAIRFPLSAMGKIDIGCTGTFIGRKVVVTAAHCVYNNNQWYKNLDVRRCKSCDPNTGYLHQWTRAIIFNGWRYSRLRSYDIAVILVDKNSPYIMKYSKVQWGMDPSLSLIMSGYPTHSSFEGCLYTSLCSQSPFSSAYYLRYYCSASEGNDGSALYTAVKSGSKYSFVVQGVHTDYSVYGSNSGVRLTPTHATQIRKWIQAFNGN